MSNEDIGHVLNVIAALLTLGFLVALVTAGHEARRKSGRSLVLYPLACACASTAIGLLSVANLLGT